MPTRLTRYILGEIFKIFIVALIVLTILILLIGVGRELIRKGLGPAAVLQLLPFILPIALQHAVPATALFSVCCVYGKMAADGEVSTVKASGISPLKLLQPALVFAALLSPAAVFMSDVAVSWGRPGVNRVVLSSIEEITYRKLASDHSFTSDQGFSITVLDVQGRRLISPRVTVRGGKTDVSLKAREGQLTMDPESGSLILRLLDSQASQGANIKTTMPGIEEIAIPLSESIKGKDVSERSPSELPLRLVSQERIRQDSRTHATVGKLAAHTGFAILASRPGQIAGPEGTAIELELDQGNRRLTRLHTEPWRRWAEGFTCFFFVFVGAPLAMIAKTSDYWTTFGIVFLPILLIYYPLFMLGLDQAKAGSMPPYGVWAGNVVLAGIGCALIARVRRY